MNSVFVPDTHLEDHLEQVHARWQALRMSTDLQARSERIQAEMDTDAFDRMMTAASRAKSGGQRVLWLHRAADVVAGAVSRSKASACTKGCDHCCHIPVSVSRAEAAHLAAVSGKRMATAPAHAVRVSQEPDRLQGDGAMKGTSPGRWEHHIGEACPFLSHGECTVWASRPLACRYYYSIDKDNLLCKLLPDKQGIEVPQLNVLAFTAMYWGILGLNQDVADIRDWFPDEA
ncbi:YkgJ family cysteine cluster protein [Hydrogenophaga atypica]|uniref:YkgJ family cysteine cluster protein n=1 Tax=Hydrogenophaga atypica TaxID=249409 RepID=A0ABW2QSP3_9BURK